MLEKKPGGWAKLDCGGAQGFSRPELLGESKPNLGPLLEQARSAKRTALDRLNLAIRAASLVPGQEEATRLIKALFFDAEFENLATARKKGGNPRTLEVACPGPCPGHDPAPCLEKQDNPQGDFARAVMRGEDVVRLRELHDYADWQVEAGHFTWGDEARTRLTFQVENEYHAPPMPALYLALVGKAPDAAHPKPAYVDPKAAEEEDGPAPAPADVEKVLADCKAEVGTSCDVALFQACVESADDLTACDEQHSECSNTVMRTCGEATGGCESSCESCKRSCASAPRPPDCLQACARRAARCKLAAGEEARIGGNSCDADAARCR